jgi:tetratricopeptide (TPR) repeat protein
MTLQGGSAMSRMLGLVDSLLVAGRKQQQLGREGEALKIFKRLASFGDLPEGVAEETQARLGEIQVRRGHYRKARRHLAAALAHQPQSSRYHALMAGALAADDRKGDRELALAHYRLALDLDGDDPDCLSEYGLLAVRMGETGEGFAALRQAVEMCPSNPELVTRLVDALGEEGREDEARQVLRLAVFQNPRDARFQRLYGDWRFHELRRQQQSEIRGMTAASGTSGPRILPFVRMSDQGREEAKGRVSAKIVRRDPPAPQPFKPRQGRLRQRRSAP